MNTFFLMALLFLPLPAFAADSTADSYNTPIVFGVMPQGAAITTYSNWEPFVRYLRSKTPYTFTFNRIAPEMRNFEDDLTQSNYDLVYMNPLNYVMFHAAGGYNVIAKEQGIPLKGLIIVRKGSNLRTIHDLKGVAMAFPDPAEFAGTIVPMAYLKAKRIIVRPHYLSFSSSIFYAVARGLYPAGGGSSAVLDTVPAEIRDQLQVLWVSPSYTPAAIAVHKRLPPAVATRLRAVLLGMSVDLAGKEVLAKLGLQGFASVTNTEYDQARALWNKLE